MANYPPVERHAYSVSEVAAALGCTRQHIHNLISRGAVASVKIGASRRISAAELARLVSAGTEGAA